jgi:hypothetical protein
MSGARTDGDLWALDTGLLQQTLAGQGVQL